MGNKFVDQYSYLHFASGIIAYYWGLTFTQWCIIHLSFEILENTPLCIHIIDNYVPFWPGGKLRADSIINIVGDNCAAFVGWYSAYLLDRIGSKMGWYLPHLQ